ncbi:MAG: arsenate reductase ArsC [Candidatus Zhuqueibacterota bacterium]
MKEKILVLCTGNSCRSQMAEGYFRHFAGEKFEVTSAGLEPSVVNPKAIQVMLEDGVDISSHTSKDVEQFIGQNFNYIITVCDNAKERCPFFPGQAERILWSFVDPAGAQGSEAEIFAMFRKVRDQIRERIKEFLNEFELSI